MRKIVLLFFIAAAQGACAQTAQKGKSVKVVVSPTEVARIETVLASDSLRGRRAGTPDIDKAASFIAGEFRKAGLQPLKGSSFLQEFSMLRPQLKDVKVKLEGSDADAKNVVVLTSQPILEIDEKSGYEIRQIGKGENMVSMAREAVQSKRNTIVFVDESFSANFQRLNGLKRALFKSPYTTVFILGSTVPKEYKIKAEHAFEESKFANVVGILPGRSKKGESVVFSGHYDHLGVSKTATGDSIFNGANDDAAGTTAVILLADYFKKLNNNERTLVFAAFTAEEVGGFGSQYFSQQFDPAQVVAMFNIEMIGTESKWGKNSAYITGYEKSDMGAILQKNLKGTAFTFYPDPYPEEQLFYRSDNATLARLGVPAHTISTSKMDSEPNYHKVSDEVGTLDLENMARIIEAVAQSSRSIVSGKDTPARVKPE